jgi:hypothetical protein
MSAAAAAAWGAVAASSLVVGCGLTLWLRPTARVVALTMAFGAGALISATSYELVLEAIAARGAVVLGMLSGAVVFYAADAMIDRRGGQDRKEISTERPTAGPGSGQAIFLGTLLDGIPESFVLGVSVVLGGSVSVAFLVAVFVSNLPEAVAATWSLHGAGWPRQATRPPTNQPPRSRSRRAVGRVRRRLRRPERRRGVCSVVRRRRRAHDAGGLDDPGIVRAGGPGIGPGGGARLHRGDHPRPPRVSRNESPGRGEGEPEPARQSDMRDR